MNCRKNTDLSLDWLSNAVREKCRETELGTLGSVTIEPLKVEGHGYTSNMERIKMVFNVPKGNKRRTIMLVTKSNKIVEGDDREGENSLWDNHVEVEVYVKVLSLMEDLMIEFNDVRDILWPTMYGYIPNAVILLEDLGQRFNILHRTTLFNEELSFLALRSLARYHAMSKILMKRGLLREQYEHEYLCGGKNPFHENFICGSAKLLTDVMIEKLGAWKSVESSHILGKRLQSALPTIYERRLNIYKTYDKRFEVLNHGDYRSGNMMFRMMEYTGRPIEIKFFDFQHPYVNSFAWDVIYLITISSEPSLRRSQRSELLEVYQQSLADNLTFFKYEGYIPTLEDVKNECDRLAIVELTSSISVTAVSNTALENAFCVDKVSTHPPEEAFNKMIFTEKEFVKVIVGDIERAINLNVI